LISFEGLAARDNCTLLAVVVLLVVSNVRLWWFIPVESKVGQMSIAGMKFLRNATLPHRTQVLHRKVLKIARVIVIRIVVIDVVLNDE
jgi:hypothetical protein